jgi:hypothetical protein
VIRHLAELDWRELDLKFESLSKDVLEFQLEYLVHKSGDNLWISFRNFYVIIEKLDSLRQPDGSNLEGFLEPDVQSVFSSSRLIDFQRDQHCFLEASVYKSGDNPVDIFPRDFTFWSRGQFRSRMT